MTVYAPLLGMLWRTLESYGVDPRQVIPANVYQPGVGPVAGDRVTLAAYDELVSRAAALVDDPAIGLQAAAKLHPSHLGALGHAWMASASLRTAICRTQRYHRMLHEKLIMRVSQEPRLLVVEYRQSDQVPVADEQADSLLASMLNLCRFDFGAELIPAFVRMRRARPLDVDPWNRCFGVEVEFGRDRNCLAIHNRDADKQLTGSSPQLVTIHEDILRRRMVELDRSDVVNRASIAILDQLPSGQLSEERVATQLNMTRRTLYNNLRGHGASYRSLLTGIRKDLVRRYLLDPSYSVTEVAFLLGYSDSGAFSRAFRGWFGVSPTEYRQSRR
jgi:AraC-like DNA-binding protein